MKKLLVLFLVGSISSTFGWAKIATSFLKEKEGYQPTPYKCQAGRMTIGYGFTDPKLIAMKMMPEGIATNHLQAKVLKAGKDIMSLAGKTQLTDNQLAALISLYFNIGKSSFRSSTLLKKVKTGRLENVPAEFRKWVRYTDPITKKRLTSKGLVIRREAEVKLWLTK